MTPALIARLAAAAASLSALASAAAAEFYLNQVGYYPDRPKIAYVSGAAAGSFALIDTATGDAVESGSLGPAVVYSDGGLTLREADFSEWTTPGAYYLRLGDGSESPEFDIGGAALTEAARASLKAFYFSRASHAISAELGGAWARALGHPDTNVRFHSSTGRTGFAAAPKGWYDAGDYGKYVVNGGYTLGTLLSLAELLPGAVGDATGIPESGNGLSDLLDEARWELEWFLAMQDADGGVFHKLTTLNFVGFVMPHQTSDQRYFIGKSVTAALNFAACAAQAARLYEAADPGFAAKCLDAAERAWTWAKANPTAYYNQPGDVSTGAYGDGSASDEFIWAAAQLYLTTGDAAYRAELSGQLAAPNVDAAAGWPNTRNLGLYSLATVDSGLPDADKARVRDAIVARAETVLAQIEANAIRSPLAGYEFNWGSNGSAAAKGVLLAYAFNLSGDARFADGMAEIADFLLGRNATGYCFLTGFGEKSPLHIHHRPSGADGVAEPVPGFLVGGPNRNREDSAYADYIHPPSQPARSYVDVEPSYASNEIAINWNAPAAFLFAALEEATPAPLAPQPDHYFAAPGEAAAHASVLANDSPKPHQLVATLVEAPAIGELALAEDGSFEFEAPGFFGNVYFTYAASSRDETSEPIVVAISVVPEDFDRSGPVPSAYEVWLLNHPALAGDDAAPGADPDGDGLSNIWESLAFSDPASPDLGPAGRLVALPPEPGRPLRARLRIAADYELRGARLRLLARESLVDGDWQPLGSEGAPALGVEPGPADPETGLRDLAIESEDFGSGALFLRAEAAQEE